MAPHGALKTGRCSKLDQNVLNFLDTILLSAHIKRDSASRMHTLEKEKKQLSKVLQKIHTLDFYTLLDLTVCRVLG